MSKISGRCNTIISPDIAAIVGVSSSICLLLRMAMKRGNRVYVQWWDISADLHTEDRIEPILAECVGWIERNNKKELALTYCRYKKGTCKLKDGIAIPKGAVESVEVI
jgi:hypothetical protein